jgi:ribulose-bisphosphate carboxylase large chain
VILNSFKGPRFGILGLRKNVNAIKRPILASALKPMGLSSSELAKTAATMVEAGIDFIEDDHSLANQKWSTWNERVKIIADSVNEANVKFNRNSVYVPSMNRPTEQILDAAIKAKEIGCGAVLVLPGITGFDSMRMIADCDEVALPIMCHPANLGSYFMNPNHGLNHEIILATLTRLSGADMSIFPNFAGRFSFSKEECLTIANSCREKLGNLKYDEYGEYEQLRCVRLVVDTGINYYGWSFNKALNYMKKHLTSLSIDEIYNEITRYICDPGQALAYKIGERFILKLRN